MNREALLVYLHDLRDLEVSKYQIEKMRSENFSDRQFAERRIQNDINTAKKKNYRHKPELPEFTFITFVGFIVFLLGAIVMMVDLLVFGSESLSIVRKKVDIVCFLVGALFAGVSGFFFFRKMKEYIKERREVKRHNAKEKERLKNGVPALIAEKDKLRQEIIVRSSSKEQTLKNGLAKVTALLEDAYSLNILARPYRNLSSIYYIYDYMSTSQATLEETFMHERMENGFQRIEKKLDIIIEQNEEIIFTSRRIEANTAKTVEQTKEMLGTLQKSLESQLRTEQNVLEAAQYAAISATYSRTTAFYAEADYLKKGYQWY